MSFVRYVNGLDTPNDITVGKLNHTSVNLAARVIVPKFCFSKHIEMCLELIPVVEKPEIVQAKEQKLKNLGTKYLVDIFSDVLVLNKTPIGMSNLTRQKMMD